MFRLLRNFYLQIKDVSDAQNFKKDVISSLCKISLAVISLADVAAFLFAIISFVLSGGYAKQVETINQLGVFDGTYKALTYGTSSVMTTLPFSVIMIILFAASLVLIIIKFFRGEAGKARKIVVSIIMGLIALVGLITFLWNEISQYRIELSEEFREFLLETIGKIGGQNVLAAYTAICVVLSLSLLLLMMIKSGCGYDFIRLFVFAIITFLVFPLIIVLLENIIPLIVFAVIAIIALFFIKISFPTTANRIYNHESGTLMRQNGYIVHYDDGFFGPKTSRVCTVEEYESGEVDVQMHGEHWFG